MKKAMWVVVVPALVAAGCLRIDTRVRANVDEGRIEAVGTNADVNQAIRQLIADRGWTSVGEGVRTASFSSFHSGSRAGPPDQWHSLGDDQRGSPESWIDAKRGDGKVVRFSIRHVNGRPVTVQVSTGEGSRSSCREITADLAQRLQGPAYGRPDRGPLTICLGAFTRSNTEPTLYEAPWTTRGAWPRRPEYVQFELRDSDRTTRSYSIRVDESLAWKALERNATGASVETRLERPVGVMVLEGDRSDDTAGGRATFEPNAVYVGEWGELVRTKLDTGQLLMLFFNPVELDYARQVKQALGDELTLDGLLMLSNYHVAPDYIKGSREAGYAFSVEEFVRLTNYHVPLETLRGFQRAGYNFSVDQFIRIRNYHLAVEDFTGFRAAGYDFSIDEMIRAKNYHVPVEMARTLRDAGFRYNLDELIRLLNYHVSPEDIIAWNQAGYKLSIDEIIKAKNYHIHASDAAHLKRVGYDFSLDELIRLRNYNVPPDFIVQVHSPNYENFTADELIEFHQKRMSAETLNKIRTAKRRGQP